MAAVVAALGRAAPPRGVWAVPTKGFDFVVDERIKAFMDELQALARAAAVEAVGDADADADTDADADGDIDGDGEEVLTGGVAARRCEVVTGEDGCPAVSFTSKDGAPDTCELGEAGTI
jgi:hypothetical protein